MGIAYWNHNSTLMYLKLFWQNLGKTQSHFFLPSLYLSLRWVLNFSDEIFGSMESTRPKDFLFVPDLWQDGTITTALTLAWILLEFGLRFCWKQKSFQSWICKRTSAVKIFLLGGWSPHELKIQNLADELQQPLKLFENWLHEQNVNSRSCRGITEFTVRSSSETLEDAFAISGLRFLVRRCYRVLNQSGYQIAKKIVFVFLPFFTFMTDRLEGPD